VRFSTFAFRILSIVVRALTLVLLFGAATSPAVQPEHRPAIQLRAA